MILNDVLSNQMFPTIEESAPALCLCHHSTLIPLPGATVYSQFYEFLGSQYKSDSMQIYDEKKNLLSLSEHSANNTKINYLFFNENVYICIWNIYFCRI